MSSPETTPTESKTQLTNPPAKQTKMVKIKAIYPIRVGEGKDERTVTEGQTVSVSEEDAVDFCDRKYDIGHKQFTGYQMGDKLKGAPRMQVVRAERVQVK